MRDVWAKQKILIDYRVQKFLQSREGGSVQTFNSNLQGCKPSLSALVSCKVIDKLGRRPNYLERRLIGLMTRH